MITVGIAAILITLALPSFTTLINRNRLVGQANEVVASLQLARMESVRQNRRAVVCKSANGATCDTSTGNWTGWITYLDMNSNGSPEAAEIIRTSVVKTPLRVSSGVQTISFRPDGFARQATTGALLQNDFNVCIATTQPAQNRRIVAIGSGGSRISTSEGTGTCS